MVQDFEFIPERDGSTSKKAIAALHMASSQGFKRLTMVGEMSFKVI